MSAPAAGRLMRRAWSTAARGPVRPTCSIHGKPFALRLAYHGPAVPSRQFSVSPFARAGIMPDSENPPPPKDEPHVVAATEPTDLDENEYHERADEYLDAVHEKASELQESREDVEVEFSAGVLSITFPPNGTYILNKQPPNKQIWLSSPLTGPKRYDWVLSGESMHQKEGTGKGEWMYLRDSSTLTSLLNKELGILVDPHEVDIEPSKDPTE